MSTRSTIAIENADGTVKKVYCHFDGYIKHNGQILAEHYSNYADWKALCLGKDIRGIDPRNGVAKPEFYDHPEDTPFWPTPYANYADYVASIDHLFHEYNYIMRKDGKMEVIIGNHRNPSKAKPKSLKRCVGRIKAKQFLKTKNSMNVLDENATI